MDLERLDEATKNWQEYFRDRTAPDGLSIYLAWVGQTIRDLLANGERVEPDYEDAISELIDWLDRGRLVSPREAVKAIVDAAIGDRLLVDYPKEAENE